MRHPLCASKSCPQTKCIFQKLQQKNILCNMEDALDYRSCTVPEFGICDDSSWAAENLLQRSIEFQEANEQQLEPLRIQILGGRTLVIYQN